MSVNLDDPVSAYSCVATGPVKSKMGNTQPVKYNGCIQLEFDAYTTWRDHTGNFEFFFTGQNESKLCLCKTDDPESSCIIIELKVPDSEKCFVQCKKYNSLETPLPRERHKNSHQSWNLGTALYACHTFAYRNYSSITKKDITSRSFAKELVRYMVEKGPSNEAIKNPINTVENLMKWSKQLDINMNVVGNAQLL